MGRVTGVNFLIWFLEDQVLSVEKGVSLSFNLYRKQALTIHSFFLRSLLLISNCLVSLGNPVSLPPNG